MPKPGYSYQKPKEKDWVYNEGKAAIAGVLADGAQETLADIPIEHPGTTEDYASGTIEGMRIGVNIDPQVNTARHAPAMVVLLLKQGESVPTVNTNAAIKQVEDRVWLVGKATLRLGISAGGSVISHEYMANPKTARRFQKGDRIVIIAINRDATAWTNPHSVSYAVEFYAVQ